MLLLQANPLALGSPAYLHACASWSTRAAPLRPPRPGLLVSRTAAGSTHERSQRSACCTSIPARPELYSGWTGQDLRPEEISSANISLLRRPAGMVSKAPEAAAGLE